MIFIYMEEQKNKHHSPEDKGQFEMNVIIMEGNKLMKYVSFFDYLDDAIENCKDFDGLIKIYDNKHRIVHSHERHRGDSYS